MKKGMLYTTVVILFLMVLLIIFFISDRYSYLDRQKLYEQRIRTMNDFLTDFYDDANERSIYIITVRSFISLDEYVASTGEFLTDVEDDFTSLFVNGTLNGTSMSYLDDSTFNDYLDRVKINARAINLNLSANITSASLKQTTPWFVDVSVNVTIHLKDKTNLAEWIVNKTLETQVSILDLRDPLYALNCPQAVSIIAQSPHQLSELVDDAGDKNDTTNFMEVIYRNNHTTYFFASEYAPNFLMRYEGKFSNSTNGIFSFVDLDYLGEQECWTTEDKSNVDYIYFNWTFNASSYEKLNGFGNNISAYESVCIVQTMPAWFRMLKDDGPWDNNSYLTPNLFLLDAKDVGIIAQDNSSQLDYSTCTSFRLPGPPPSIG